MEPFYRTFGARLRQARRGAGLTQETLAKRVGLGRTSIANIERGRQRVPLHTFVDLARALGVQAATLLPEAKTTQASGAAEQLRQAGRGPDIVAWAERALAATGVDTQGGENVPERD